MKKHFALLPIILLFLVGCETTHYGIRESVWVTLTEEQKQATIDSYNQARIIREQRRLEEAKIRLEQERLERERQEQLIETVRSRAPILQVHFQGGELKKDGVTYRFPRKKIYIKHGTTEEYFLKSDQDGVDRYRLVISYTDAYLKIGRKKKSVKLDYEESWLRGKRYSQLRISKGDDFRAKFSVDVRRSNRSILY